MMEFRTGSASTSYGSWFFLDAFLRVFKKAAMKLFLRQVCL